MDERKTVMIRDLLETYARATLMPEETDHERALQMVAFLSGVIAATATLARGKALDLEDYDELIVEAEAGIHYEDEPGSRPPPTWPSRN